jgi:hypothetical protein
MAPHYRVQALGSDDLEDATQDPKLTQHFHCGLHSEKRRQAALEEEDPIVQIRGK